jgi:hypothetical protein
VPFFIEPWNARVYLQELTPFQEMCLEKILNVSQVHWTNGVRVEGRKQEGEEEEEEGEEEEGEEGEEGEEEQHIGSVA